MRVKRESDAGGAKGEGLDSTTFHQFKNYTISSLDKGAAAADAATSQAGPTGPAAGPVGPVSGVGQTDGGLASTGTGSRAVHGGALSGYPTPNHTPTPRRQSDGAVDPNGIPFLSRDFVVRRISEGETGRLKEELKCEACGKGYRHITSLAKHLWEHTPEWQKTKRFSISKHQQVQLLEAASILCGLNEAPKVVRRPRGESRAGKHARKSFSALSGSREVREVRETRDARRGSLASHAPGETLTPLGGPIGAPFAPLHNNKSVLDDSM